MGVGARDSPAVSGTKVDGRDFVTDDGTDCASSWRGGTGSTTGAEGSRPRR